MIRFSDSAIFWNQIGKQNQLRVRHITIQITDSSYVYLSHECRPGYDSCLNCDNGRMLTSAFTLPAENHNLSSLNLDLWNCDPSQLFRDTAECEVLRQLVKIRGLAVFHIRFPPFYNWSEESKKVYEEVRECMEDSPKGSGQRQNLPRHEFGPIYVHKVSDLTAADGRHVG